MFKEVGTGDDIKTDGFSKKYQTAFDTPQHFPFLEHHVEILLGRVDQKGLFRGPKSLELFRKFICFGIVISLLC